MLIHISCPIVLLQQGKVLNAMFSAYRSSCIQVLSTYMVAAIGDVFYDVLSDFFLLDASI